MRTLVDTNILTRLSPSALPMNQAAVAALAELRQQGDELIIMPQNLYEFWVVCTRPPAQNGFGLSAVEAQTELIRVKGFCTLLEETPAVLGHWEQLVVRHQVLGKNGHDAHIVAALLAHGLDRLLTFNAADFQRFPGITVLTPQQVLAATQPSP